MPEPIESVMIGAGGRGFEVYGAYALKHPGDLRFVAVAEPNEARRLRFAHAHDIPPERRFRSWEDLYEKGRIARALFNCTLDRMHAPSTLPALEQGYDVLLEKPMAHDLAGNVRLVQTAEKHGRLMMIGHILRYTAFFSALHDVIASGRLGKIVSVEHRENVAYWHMAHSFVRGNWRNDRGQSPMILAKCCHDLDVLFWNLGPVRRLQSFGSLIHYRPENAPAGAPPRCTDGCPVAEQCPFYAPRQYLGDHVGWPVSVISEDTSLPARRRALETGPYGRCVYHCDNSVVDNQTVNMELDNGATATLFMHGHSHQEGRTMRYDGSRATLRARFGGGDAMTVHDHRTGQAEEIDVAARASGHGGGDAGLTEAFVRAIRGEAGAEPLTTARESLESHFMAFAAEESRKKNRVVSMDNFRRKAEEKGARKS